MILWSMKTLGKLVRERRESAGYKNQRDFADALGRAQSWVSRLEADRMMAAPGPEELRAIAKIIPVSVAEMLAAMGYDIETGSEGDSPAVSAVRAILEGRDFTDRQVDQLTRGLRNMIEMLEG